MEPSAATPVATTKCPPAGWPFWARASERSAGDPQDAPADRDNGCGHGRWASNRLGHRYPAREIGRPPQVDDLLARSGAGQISIAVRIAFEIHRAIGSQVLIQGSQIGQAIGRWQLARILEIAENRSHGGQQRALSGRWWRCRCRAAPSPTSSSSENWPGWWPLPWHKTSPAPAPPRARWP